MTASRPAAPSGERLIPAAREQDQAKGPFVRSRAEDANRPADATPALKDWQRHPGEDWERGYGRGHSEAGQDEQNYGAAPRSGRARSPRLPEGAVHADAQVQEVPHKHKSGRAP